MKRTRYFETKRKKANTMLWEKADTVDEEPDDSIFEDLDEAEVWISATSIYEISWVIFSDEDSMDEEDDAERALSEKM